MNSPSETLRDSIIKIVNENTVLGEFKAVPVTDQILDLILNKLPEKKEFGTGKYSEHGEGWNEALDSFKQILEGK